MVPWWRLVDGRAVSKEEECVAPVVFGSMNRGCPKECICGAPVEMGIG
jgi:hypothetical protein